MQKIICDPSRPGWPRLPSNEEVRAWMRSRDLTGLLTDREREIFDLMVAGRSNKEIGASLGVAHRTVTTHVSRILEKVGCTSPSQYVV